MKIKATQQIEVQITPEEERRIAIDYFCKKFDWQRSYFIKDGVVYNTVTNHSSHSWREDKHIRDATANDKLICSLIELS